MFRSRSSAATGSFVSGTFNRGISQYRPSSNPIRSRLMFLSRLILNSRSPKARLDLAQPYQMHRTIWNCHPTLRRDPATGEFLDRLLFRVDSDNGPPTVLVQSEVEPDWHTLPADYLRTSPPDCKTLDVSFAAGQR